ncbi:MAG: GAF domain-containing protein [Chloroflexi bacterium]|nr:GAF domain-containing protein [Chloroflexota bacterium]
MSSIVNRFFGNQTSRAGTDDLQYWRQRILNTLLVAASILGGVVYIYNLTASDVGSNIISIITYSLIYLWALSVTIFRRLPYWVRAGSFLMALYGAGLISALQYASIGDVRIWWTGVTILAGIFFGTRIGTLIAVISTTNYLALGWFMNKSIIPVPVLTAHIDAADLFPWISTSIPYFLVNLLAVISFGVLLNSLQSSLQKATELTTELEQDRVKLQHGTAQLERREIQISTAAEISRAISAELDTAKIFSQIVELAKERFGLYYVGVFMLDRNQQYAVLRAGSGEAGKRMLAAGHKLPIGGTSMIGWCIANRQARIDLDVGDDAVHFQNPHLPSTRSELALPIIREGRALGALTVQSVRQEAFDENDITVLQGIADSLASAIYNASLFNQLQESLDEIRALHRQYLSRGWEDVAQRESALDFTFENPDAATPGASAAHTTTIPLLLRGQSIGSIIVEHEQTALSAEDKKFIDSITAQAALALENARLVQQTERSAQYNRSVAEITSKVWSSTNVDTILRTALQELGKTLGASDGVIELYVPETETHP